MSLVESGAPLAFHQAHGANIDLLDDRRRALRYGTVDSSLFSSLSLGSNQSRDSRYWFWEPLHPIELHIFFSSSSHNIVSCIRRSSYEKSLCFSHRPLRPNEPFVVTIEQVWDMKSTLDPQLYSWSTTNWITLHFDPSFFHYPPPFRWKEDGQVISELVSLFLTHLLSLPQLVLNLSQLTIPG